ncbi:MAG: hypothetical protein WCP29_02455 [Acidobacteriota bacterium]
MMIRTATLRPRFAARVLLVLACGAASVSADAPRGQAVPAFRFEADRLALDVGVVDATGKAVRTLSAGDFEVTIDGRSRQVVAADWVSGRAGAGTAAAETAQTAARSETEDALDATFSSNERGDPAGLVRPTRDLVIAIDQNSFEPGASRAVAAAAQQLIDRFAKDERVGLMAFPSPGIRLSPTRERDRLKSALGQLTGSADRLPYTETGLTVGDALVVVRGGDQLQANQILSRECDVSTMSTASTLSGEAEACRQRVTSAARALQAWARRRSLISLNGFRDVIASLAGRGRPATVILVSSGIILGDYSRTMDLETETRDVASLSAAAQIGLYGLFVDSSFLEAAGLDRDRVRGFANSDRDLKLGGLQTLTGLGGGSVASLQGRNDAVFSRLASELDGYYLLTIQCAPADRDGKMHRVKVNVRTPSLTVRSREEVLVPMARAYSGDDAVTFALNSQPLQRALPIRVSTQVLRDAADRSVRVVIAGNIGRGVVGAEPVRVGYSMRTTVGGEGLSGVELRTLAVVGTGADASFQFVDAVTVVPGRYLLRVAALDSAGRLGSVDHVVDATLVRGQGVTMSDLVLIDPLRKAEGQLSPVADGRITSSRLEAVLEVYPDSGQQVSAVAFDIADSPDAPAILSGQSPAPERDGGIRRTAAVSFDLSSLPPGIYTAVARVLGGEKLLGRASRPFRLDRMLITAGGPRAPFSVAASGGLVPPFGRESVLRADALQYFLGRLKDADATATSGDAASAADAVREGRYETVDTVLGQARADRLSVVFLRGLALFGRGELEPAAAQFRAALRLSNDFLPAAFYLGACYAAGGRDREAAGAWQTSLISEGESRIVFDALADALLRLKDGRRAMDLLTEARGRWPDDDALLPRLAAAQVLLDRRAEALATLAPYISRHSSDREAVFLALRLLYEAHATGGRLGSAREDAEMATAYGALYRAAGGPQLALVDRWVAFIRRGT